MIQQTGNAEKILRVGVHLMAKKGYQGTSTREIVEAAGVTKPMLYYYYGSKEGLCKAGIRRFSEHFFKELREVLGATEDSRELLVEYIWTVFKYMQDHEDEGLFYMSLFFGPERQWFLNDIKEVLADGQELTLTLIDRLIGAGILRPDCEEEFARTVRGMVDVWRWAAITEGITLSRAIAERIADNLLHGFGTR
jgi:AcrR family transcriptional regulator